MTENEKKNEWLRFIKTSQPSYKLNALKAVLETDGAAMLEACLGELGLLRSVDLVKVCDTASSHR